MTLSDELQAQVKTPPGGMIQLLGPSVTVRHRGRTLVEAAVLYSIDLDGAVALRDDVRHRVIVVRPGVEPAYLPCEGGTLLAPERFAGIDCWRGRTTADFALIRYAPSGAIAHTYGPPAAAAGCGRSRVSYIGYEESGEPVIGYECMSDGHRVCRAAGLAAPERALDERRASTPDVDCGYFLKTEGERRYSDVRRWDQVK